MYGDSLRVSMGPYLDPKNASYRLPTRIQQGPITRAHSKTLRDGGDTFCGRILT